LLTRWKLNIHWFSDCVVEHDGSSLGWEMKGAEKFTCVDLWCRNLGWLTRKSWLRSRSSSNPSSFLTEK
jgi:hypothetical protein